MLYTVANNTLYAFDATGQTNCVAPVAPLRTFFSFTKYCQPLWSAQLGGSVALGGTYPLLGNGGVTVAVANGYVYVGDSTGTFSAFAAGGCGATTCTSSWTAKTGGAIESSAATPSTVFVGSDDGPAVRLSQPTAVGRPPASRCGRRARVE